MKTKYIVYADGFMENIVIFGEAAVHKDVAKGKEVLGAGFCHIDVVEPNNSYCYGRSDSLDIDSRGDDDSDWLRMLVRNMVKQS